MFGAQQQRTVFAQRFRAAADLAIADANDYWCPMVVQ